MTSGGVYVASKTDCAPMWRMLREYGALINSTWIDEAEIGQTADAAELWERVIREVSEADRVVVYARRADVLTGALVEIGAALASGKPVYLLGDCEQFNKRCSFTAHPLVRRARDFAEAFGECAAPVATEATWAVRAALASVRHAGPCGSPLSERDERYCEIAARRLSQEVLDFDAPACPAARGCGA